MFIAGQKSPPLKFIAETVAWKLVIFQLFSDGILSSLKYTLYNIHTHIRTDRQTDRQTHRIGSHRNVKNADDKDIPNQEVGSGYL